MRRLALTLALAACSGAPGDEACPAPDGGPPDASPPDAPPPDASPPDAPPLASCIDPSELASIDRPFACAPLGRIQAPTTAMPYDCHTQGIGYSAGSFVIDCMDLGGPDARILRYPSAANDGVQFLPDAVVAADAPAGQNHPSATQVLGDVFPVALAPPADTGPSEVRFFRLAADGTLAGPLAVLPGPDAHLGALAYSSFEGQTWLVGCGWSCTTFAVWRAPGDGATEGFVPISFGATASFVEPGVDTNVGAYNSIALLERCGDHQPVLLASHDDWLDIWELSDLGTSSPRLKKVKKRQITEVTTPSGRPLLAEGMTVEITGGRMFLWAAPHDYGTSGCRAGTRCMQQVYRCAFGP